MLCPIYIDFFMIRYHILVYSLFIVTEYISSQHHQSYIKRKSLWKQLTISVLSRWSNLMHQFGIHNGSQSNYMFGILTRTISTISLTPILLTQGLLGDGLIILKVQSLNACYRLNLFWNCSHMNDRTHLMINQYWFRWWLGAIRQQAKTIINVDPVLCHHMGH